MGQEGRGLQRDQRLEGLGGVLVVVGVALQLEEQVVGEAVGRVPAVQDGHLLEAPARQRLPLQPVVFNVVYRLQVKYRPKRHQRMHYHRL